MISRSRAVRVVAAAAMTGMMAGAVSSIGGCKDNNPPSNNPGMSSDNGTTAAGMAKHDCKGMNACKGQGGCSAGDNGCKGKNSCKGKGGCNTNK
jgi:hypothetical protein